MRKFSPQYLITSFSLALVGVLLVGTVLFLIFFMRTTMRAVAASAVVATLKDQVATESLNRSRFETVIERLKKKTAPSTIDWKALHDPF